MKPSSNLSIPKNLVGSSSTTDSTTRSFEAYKDYYERGGKGYFVPLNEVMKFHLDRLPRWIDDVPLTASILDVGCGNGYLLSLLSQMGYHNLSGVDISDDLIEEANARLAGRAEVVHSDLKSYLSKRSSNSFDVIIFNHVIEHVPREDTIKILRDMRRCLTESGKLGVKTPNAASLMSGYLCFGDFTHLVYFNERSLAQVLESAGFDVQKIHLIIHKPRLFFLFRHPIRTIFRTLGLIKWWMGKGLHVLLWLLFDIKPSYGAWELELEMLALK